MVNKALAWAIGIILLILVGSGIIAGVYFGLVPQTIFAETIYKANWGHICCEEGAYEPTFTRYIDDYSLYICNAYTDECEISMHPGEKLGVTARSFYFQICDIQGNPNTCGSKDYMRWGGFSPPTETEGRTLQYGQSIKFSPTPFPNNGDWKFFVFDAKYRKFYIQGEENGKVFVAKSCILNSELKERVLAGGLNELSKTGMNRCQNYITDYIQVATKTYSYKGEKVLCQARDIYEIDTISLLDGSTERIQGERIKEVDCCPTEANCGDDFEFKEDEPGDCPLGYDYECTNGGEPIAITGTSYVKWSCMDNACVKSGEITVECTNNAICVDKLNKPNAVCKDFKCVIDDDWLGHCGDGECETILGETPTSCPDDCANDDDEVECPKIVLIKKSKLTPEVAIPNIPCIINNFVQGIIWAFAIVAGLLGGLLGLLFGNRFIPRQIRKRWAYLLGIFVVLAIEVFIVSLIYFWWIMLALIILGILKLLIPGV